MKITLNSGQHLHVLVDLLESSEARAQLIANIITESDGFGLCSITVDNILYLITLSGQRQPAEELVTKPTTGGQEIRLENGTSFAWVELEQVNPNFVSVSLADLINEASNGEWIQSLHLVGSAVMMVIGKPQPKEELVAREE